MSPDLLVATATAVLAFIAWRMLLRPTTYIDPRESLPTATALVALGWGMIWLSAPLGATVTFISATAWLGISVFRAHRPHFM